MLGWKYVSAEEEAQKYKVGMFILETKRVIRSVDWENEAASNVALTENGGVPSQERKDVV